MEKFPNRKKNSGFTLIELIVVVSVAAILASIAIPNFKTMIINNRTTAGTNELVSVMVLARSEALKRSKNISVCTSDDQITCLGNTKKNFALGWIMFVDCNNNGIVNKNVDCNNDGVPDEDEEVLKAHIAIKDLHIFKNGKLAKRHYFTYNYSGRIGNPFTINVKKGAATLRKVKVSRSGRVRTCDPVKDTSCT